MPEAGDLLRSVRRSKHNRRSISFAIVEPETRLGIPFGCGAHFVIHKPLSVEGSKRTLRAAHGLMMREKRNHFRADVSTGATLRTYGKPATRVLLLDLCRTGALIDSRLLLKKGQTVHLRFTVPETSIEIGVDAVVRWADITGRAGLFFQTLNEGSRLALGAWMRKVAVEEVVPYDLLQRAGITSAFERVRAIGLR
jgi:hypothetical protein